jgi:hypothetical protein
MKTMIIILRAVSISLSLGLTAPALAAGEVPPEGAATIVTDYAGRIIDVADLGNGDSETLVEATGVSRNALGQTVFDNLSARCLILSRVIGGQPTTVAGACSETDSDGDIIFSSFDGDTWRLIGGAGKYKGISGSARNVLTPQPSTEPGTIAYSVRQEVAWTIR